MIQYPSVPGVVVYNSATLTPAKKRELAELAARAYSNSEVLNYFACGTGQAGIVLYMEMLIEVAMEFGWVVSNEEVTAAAFWVAPGQQVSMISAIRIFWYRIYQVTGWKLLPRMIYDLLAMDKIHNEIMDGKSHAYLLTVVTEPGHMGNKLASQLLRPVWDLCDRKGYWAYLESDDSDPTLKQLNSDIYRHYGFEEVGPVKLWDQSLWNKYPAMVQKPIPRCK